MSARWGQQPFTRQNAVICIVFFATWCLTNSLQTTRLEKRQEAFEQTTREVFTKIQDSQERQIASSSRIEGSLQTLIPLLREEKGTKHP